MIGADDLNAQTQYGKVKYNISRSNIVLQGQI